MRNILTLALLLLLATPILASSNLPTLIQRYQRGDWGYQRLSLIFGGSFDGYSYDYNYPYLNVTTPDSIPSGQQGARESSSYGLNGGLHYIQTRESENVCYRFVVSPNGSWNKGKTESEDYITLMDGEEKRTYDYTHRRYYTISSLSGDYRLYWKDELHWVAGLDARCMMEIYTNDYKDNERKDENDYMDYDAVLKLGLGYGRTRDVTNVVRARWMADQLLRRHNIALSDEQILRLAQMLDSELAYNSTFSFWNNASESTFWRDVMTELNLHLTYDQFLDMTQEARTGTLLNRQQGRIYEFGFLGKYSYYESNQRTVYYEEPYSESERNQVDDYNSFGVYARFDSWTNLSTHTQLSFSTPIECLFCTSEETYERIDTYSEVDDKVVYTNEYSLLTLSPEIEYLYQITDELGCTIESGVAFYSFSGDVDYSYLRCALSSNLTYYIDPSTQLKLSAKYSRLDFFSDEAVNDGGKQQDDFGVDLTVQWRPFSWMF